jgi:oxygen-dependent protoporphyrinogen oxidase
MGAAVNERVIVVGAGIAGLTAAFRLKQRGFDVTVLEAEAGVGGRMATLERDGYRMDLGAAALSRKYTAMQKLAADAGIGHKLVDSSDMVAIPRNGSMHRIRSGSALDSLRTGLLSWGAKIPAAKLALEARKIAKKMTWDDIGGAHEWDVESVAQWSRRIGNDEVERYLSDAFLRGCYMEDSARMSALELHFLLINFFGSKLFTFDGGVGELPRALAGGLGVRLNTRVTGVEEKPGGVRLTSIRDGVEQTEEAAAAVITLTAPQMLEVYPQLGGDDREILAQLDYVRLITISLALSTLPAEPAMFLPFHAEAEPQLCSIFQDSVKHSSRAPAGAGLITVFWHNRWNIDEWDTEDSVIVDKSIGAAAAYLPEVENNVAFGNVKRWRHAIINSEVGTYRSLHTVADNRYRADRVQLAGDYFGGSTSNSALCSGEFAAKRLIEKFGGS